VKIYVRPGTPRGRFPVALDSRVYGRLRETPFPGTGRGLLMRESKFSQEQSIILDFNSPSA